MPDEHVLRGSAAVPITPQHDGLSWYAACTRSRSEKRVATQLQWKAIEHLLPLSTKIRRWRNGKHVVQLPLFPGYVFVRLHPQERTRVLQVDGVAYIVGSNGVPTPLLDEEIERIRQGLRAGICMDNFPYLTKGTRVEVRQGPLKGAVGILVRRRGEMRVVISLHSIQQSISVELDAADLAVSRS
jgi:transcription antitermination factor NusG